MTDNRNYNGLQAAGENNLTPEFKALRTDLILAVNGWLVELSEKRDSRQPLNDGDIIVAQPRVIRTILGKTAIGSSAMAEEKVGGVSLTGDGITSPLSLQAVLFRQDKSDTTIEATGSDPMARLYMDNGFSITGNRETVASFMLFDSDGENSNKYFGYTVLGDGSVKRKFLNNGVHTSTNLQTGEDLIVALEALQYTRDQLSSN